MSGFTVNYNSDIPGVAFNDLYLDSNGNLASVITSDAEIEETCIHAVQLTLGDYGLNTKLGIPYNDYLSSDRPVGNEIKRSISKAILAVNGVSSISSFAVSLNSSTRKLSLDIIIKLDSGNNINVNL